LLFHLNYLGLIREIRPKVRGFVTKWNEKGSIFLDWGDFGKSRCTFLLS